MEELSNQVVSYVREGGWHPFLAAAVIVVLTAILAHLATRFIRRLLNSDAISLRSTSLAVNISRATVWVIGLALMLSICFGVNVSAAIAALGVGGIALSLGLQDTLSNLIGGLQISVLSIIKPGDYVTIGSVTGTVEDITWRQTVLRDENGDQWIIPNSTINSSSVKNVESSVVVAPFVLRSDFGNIDAAAAGMEQAVLKALQAAGYEILKDPWVLYTQVGEYGAWGNVRVLLADAQSNRREARDVMVRALAPYTRVPGDND